MNTDIRLLISFKNHRKRKRLKSILGSGSTDYIIDLWLTAAEDRPEGILHGWDEIDIALAAGWEGEPKQLVDALIECHFLDVDDLKNYTLHDWEEHQGWASGAKLRSDAAKKAAKARWNNKLMLNTCESIAPAMQTHSEGIAPVRAPSPSPNRIHNHIQNKKTPQTPQGADGDFSAFWDAYPKKKAKQDALKAWESVRKKKALPDIGVILDAIEKQKATHDWTKDGGQFIPYPATWINRRQWDDDISGMQKKNVGITGYNSDTGKYETPDGKPIMVL